MARIAILAPTLASADAVSSDALGMRELLTGRGHEVQLFADDWSLLAGGVRHSSRTLSFLQNDDDVLIYHHSIGWDDGIDILQEARCTTVVKYHNVTPSKFFEGISPSHQRLCDKGRFQIRVIARSDHDLYLAASAFNLGELVAEGASTARAFVVPPFNKVDVLQSVEADLEIIDKYADGKTNLLMVGALRPSKNHLALIEAFATYYYDFDCNSRLFIVGVESDAFGTYSKSLKELTEFLCLEDRVVFTGEVSLDALKAYYLLSNCFLMTSDHEGFCVPLVEAMALKVPIVAYGSTAVPETVNGAGLVWPERNPLLMAQSIDYLVHNQSAAVRLAITAYQRYEQKFSNKTIERQFLDALLQAGLEL